MAVKKTKKLSGQTVTATVAAGEKLAKVDANGKVTLIDTANLKAALMGGLDMECMMDGVFIMYHIKANNFPLAVRPSAWPGLQSAGEVADGVMIVEGGKTLVVAPTESDGAGLLWCSANVDGGAVKAADREAAMADMAGKANTAAIIAKSTSAAVTNTAAYAPGFCNLYSRVNANGKGLTAGKWWLPSMGEMAMISANLAKINYCLGLINGATLFTRGVYWSSTEGGAANAWRIYPQDYNLYNGVKTGDRCKVRPVSTFLQ